MIKTQLTREDALKILELGRALHGESQFKHEKFDDERCWSLLDSTLRYPDRCFIAYDDQFRGMIILQMSTNFFSGAKWAGDQVFFVAPEARKHGLSDELLEAGKKWAKENGAVDLTIIHNAGIGLDWSDQYYAKRGFNLTGKVYSISLVD